MTKKGATPLRERMKEDLRLRNYTKHSEELYLFHVRPASPAVRIRQSALLRILGAGTKSKGFGTSAAGTPRSNFNFR
jgi:hypothetical protein